MPCALRLLERLKYARNGRAPPRNFGGRRTPIITFPYKRLEARLAQGARRAVPDRPTVVSSLGEFGCAIEGDPDGEMLSVEALMNRPDLFSVEGIARAMRSFLSLAPPPAYAAQKGPVALIVDPSVAPVRPEIAGAVVRGVELDEAGLASLVDTQEKLDLTYGRRRARVSIGLHDLSPLTPPITYKSVAPDAAPFVPLFAHTLPGGARALTPREVLTLHPKGIEYAHLLAGKPAYPLLVDSKGAVLSLPPIINGTLTALKAGRRDIFLDVTGTARAPVEAAARLLAMILAERGGTLESVEIRRPGEALAFEPRLEASTHAVSVAHASALVGAPLRAEEVASALERLGHRASIAESGARVDALVPPWRFDILHEADLIEDVAIGLGYRNVPGSLPRAPTLGAEHALSSLTRRARAALLGLGFLEAMTLALTSPEHTGFAPVPVGARSATTLANPITREHSALRTSLLPSLLSVLAANTQRDLPQALFEVGPAVRGGHNTTLLCAAYLGTDASFTRAKGLALALFEALGVPPEIGASGAAPFSPGRAASLASRGAALGAFGEVDPATLAAFSLTHPALALEIALDPLAAPPA